MNASTQIDSYIKDREGWQSEMLAKLRNLIHEADPEMIEEWKWSTPVFSHKGMVCALGAFADHIKVNFLKGASLPDPNKLFNAGFEAKKTRAIDLYEGDKIDETALRGLILAAVDQNR
ncbi:MAG: DUF1801 domain-containing protein [Anaerolineales bacterium]|nr:DUF1801 domain-containing protein [Anaerolineales bacterium]